MKSNVGIRPHALLLLQSLIEMLSLDFIGRPIVTKCGLIENIRMSIVQYPASMNLFIPSDENLSFERYWFEVSTPLGRSEVEIENDIYHRMKCGDIFPVDIQTGRFNQGRIKMRPAVKSGIYPF